MGFYFISFNFMKGDRFGFGSLIRKEKITVKNKQSIEKVLAKDLGFDNVAILYFKKVRRG